MTDEQEEIVVRATLAGGAGLGEVPAIDVARLIEGLVGVVVQAAGSVVGKQVAATGRHAKIVELASRIRLLEVTTGSVQIAVRPARFDEDPDALGLDVANVSEDALRVAVRVASTHAELYPEVAAAWAEAIEPFHLGVAYQAMRVEIDGAQAVTIDRARGERLRALAVANLPKVSRRTLQGVIYAANFETMTGRLRTPAGRSVEVQFDLEHADAVKEALRDMATVEGEAKYDPTTTRIVSIRLHEIDRPYQLTADHFWGHRGIAELAAEQGVTVVKSADELVAGEISDREWAAFAHELGIET